MTPSVRAGGAMLSQRTVVPPGFTELASDAELARQLGTPLFGALLRLCHLAEPLGRRTRGLVDHDERRGARGVAGSQSQDGSEVVRRPGGRGHARAHRRQAARAGTRRYPHALLHHRDRRADRSSRASSPKYTRPDLPPGTFSPGKDARVIAYPVHGARAPHLVQYAGRAQPDPVVDVSLEGTQHTAPEPAVPTWLREALHQLGYVGDLPAAVTRDVPADTLMRVIEAVRKRPGITSGPRYLNWLLRSGPAAIETFLAAEAPAKSDAVETDDDAGGLHASR